jgi:hypothetical protein
MANPVGGGLKEAGWGIMGISGGNISSKDPKRLEITIRMVISTHGYIRLLQTTTHRVGHYPKWSLISLLHPCPP